MGSGSQTSAWGAPGAHQDARLGLDAAEQHGLHLRPAVQLLPHHGHHAEAGFCHGLQALCPQLWHRVAQALWVLLRQHSWHLQQLGHLHRVVRQAWICRKMDLDPWV